MRQPGSFNAAATASRLGSQSWSFSSRPFRDSFLVLRISRTAIIFFL